MVTCPSLPLKRPDSSHSPSETTPNRDVERCARDLIEQGYCLLDAPAVTVEAFSGMVEDYLKFPAAVKQSFSFPDDTDGFLPFGMERSRMTQRVDLCERYCYRHAFRARREAHSFTKTAFFTAAVAAEESLSALAARLLQGLAQRFGQTESPQIREGSYLQFCAYQACYWQKDREFLQDRHEDGNLLTLVLATREGLVLYPNDVPLELPARPGEIVAFTGSLLAELTGNRIVAMDHAVLNPSQPTVRSSLVYFALPDLARTQPRFTDGVLVDLEPLANELHQSFGNRPFSPYTRALR